MSKKEIDELDGLSEAEIEILRSYDGLKRLFLNNKKNVRKALAYIKYENELSKLQTELVQLQNHIQSEGKKNRDNF